VKKKRDGKIPDTPDRTASAGRWERVCPAWTAPGMWQQTDGRIAPNGGMKT
jgi:hypothetical protein